MSAESLTLVNSIRESGEDVRVIRKIHTVVDTGDVQLMRAIGCPAEVQTDSEPMWCFQNAPVSLDARTEEVMVKPAVLPVQDSPMIDLRNCAEFSIVHLEDMRDPSSQFVMLQTGSSIEEPGKVANSTADFVSAGNQDTEGESVIQPHMPVEIVGAPVMFVGGSGRHWKRELELPAESETLRQPIDVDSGIWDMMQALGSTTNDSGRSDLLHVSSDRDGYSEAEADMPASIPMIQPSLQGMYKLFQIADGSHLTDSGVSDESVPNKSSYSKASSGVQRRSVGGLEDALEQVAVVDFIVHRVEAETVKLERIDSSDSCTTREQLQQQEIYQSGRFDSTTERRRRNEAKLLVDSATGVDDQSKDYSDGSCEDDEAIYGSNVATAINVRSNRPAVQTYDSATNTPRMKKKHKDVVRVTSARFGRSVRRRVSGRGRGHWKDPNCEARKSLSADVSRSSSLLDIDGGQQEMARSSDVYSDPSPEHGECRNVKTASLSVFPPRQPFTSSPYGWRRPGPAGVDSHEWFTDGSSSTMSGPMSAGVGLFAEPDLLNFEKFPDWMRDLPDAMLHFPLSDICIPGKTFVYSVVCYVYYITID